MIRDRGSRSQYMPAIGRNNLPAQRMSIYPDHVLERLSDQADILTSPGYI